MNLETLKSAVDNKKNWKLTSVKKEFTTIYILNKGNDTNHMFESLFANGDVELENQLSFIETYSQINGKSKKGITHQINLEMSIHKFS